MEYCWGICQGFSHRTRGNILLLGQNARFDRFLLTSTREGQLYTNYKVVTGLKRKNWNKQVIATVKCKELHSKVKSVLKLCPIQKSILSRIRIIIGPLETMKREISSVVLWLVGFAWFINLDEKMQKLTLSRDKGMDFLC